MRISKWYLVVCAVALGAGVVTVRADDNPAQAAARAALEDKMRALNTQPAPANTQASVPATSQKPAQPAVTTAPATPPPAQNPPAAAAPAVPEQPAPVAVTPSGAVTRQPTNPPPATTTLPATSPAVTPSRTMKPAPVTTSSNHGLFAPVPPPSGVGPGGTVSQVIQPSTNVQTPPPPVAPQKSTFTPPPNAASNAGKELGLKPILAPALPISSAQQAELQALLEKYDANAITPEQYQAERAKILAGH